jgi:hypothetical protein
MSAGNSVSPIFIGGVPRSGTTLLRVILDSHPDVFCGTELRAVHALANLWSAADGSARPLLKEFYGIDAARLRQVFAQLILSFLEPAWRASGKRRIAEKTPSNLLVFPQLRLLFPDSPLVHVIRDGRDVVASRLDRDKAAARAPLDTVAVAATRAREWVDAMSLRRRLLSELGSSGRYLEIRYESLVNEPQRVLPALFEFIDERYDARVLDFHRIARNVSGTEEWSAEAVRRPIFTSSAGRWRESLSAAEAAAVTGVAGDALRELGYDLHER